MVPDSLALVIWVKLFWVWFKPASSIPRRESLFPEMDAVRMREYPIMPVMVAALKKSRVNKEFVHVIRHVKSLTTHLQGKLEHSCRQTDKEIISAFAASNGESINAFLNRLIWKMWIRGIQPSLEDWPNTALILESSWLLWQERRVCTRSHWTIATERIALQGTAAEMCSNHPKGTYSFRTTGGNPRTFNDQVIHERRQLREKRLPNIRYIEKGA